VAKISRLLAFFQKISFFHFARYSRCEFIGRATLGKHGLMTICPPNYNLTPEFWCFQRQQPGADGASCAIARPAQRENEEHIRPGRTEIANLVLSEDVPAKSPLHFEDIPVDRPGLETRDPAMKVNIPDLISTLQDAQLPPKLRTSR